MLPLLIIWLFKKYPIPATFKVLIALILVSFATLYLQAQSMRYVIFKGGDSIGVIQYSRTSLSGWIIYKAETNVKTGFIFSISVHSREESCFKNGILQYGYVYRKVNGSVKTNNQTRLNPKNTYLINNTNRQEARELNKFPITASFLSIYCNEPEKADQIYSDTYAQMIDVVRINNEHKYKALMPDGSYNYYYFKNGICVKVEVVHTFYTLVFELTSKS